MYLLALVAVVLLTGFSMRWGAAALGVLVVAYVSHWMESMLTMQDEILHRLEDLERSARIEHAAQTPLPVYSPTVRASADDQQPVTADLPH